VNDGETAEGAAGKGSGRVDAIDLGRGLAISGMVVYHLGWDLADFHLVSPDLPFTPGMRLLSHVVASTFLALVGVSLALAHAHGFNRRASWRRLAIVAAAAAFVTAASLIFAPGQAIFFGILHCIAAASLVAAPFVTWPAWASLAAGLTAIAAPFVAQSTLFDPPWLLWLGLGEALPNTIDWYPLLPWAGVVLLGLALARAPAVLPRLTSPERWRAESAAARTISFAGRHSLAIYLLHQFILFPLVWAVAASGLVATAPASKADMSSFLSSCQRACIAEGRAAPECDTGCRCVADAVERSGDADRMATLSAGRRADLKRLADACMGR
jgi:uncharacterized membrane protein